jgi:hypothetical protein
MNRYWIQGIADAVGFVGGGVGGMLLGKTLGLDVFAPGYSNASLGGILLCGLGGGLGLQLARFVVRKINSK